jgi:hypothetical protein
LFKDPFDKLRTGKAAVRFQPEEDASILRIETERPTPLVKP